MIKTKVNERMCSECGHIKKTAHYICTCDMCGTNIEKPDHPLVSTSYKNEGSNEDNHFCCWSCLLDFNLMLEFDGFIDLGTLNFNIETEGMTVPDFWQAIDDFQLQRA